MEQVRGTVVERSHSEFSPSAHAASGIPPNLQQSNTSDHTKRLFEVVIRLGQSNISNYERVQCKSTSELLMMWGRYPHIDTSPP
jgi:hypothetical protein